MKTSDLDTSSLSPTAQQHFSFLHSLAESYSSGVYQDADGYTAWINYAPPYDDHGGNWTGYGRSPEQAVSVLYREIRAHLLRKSHV